MQRTIYLSQNLPICRPAMACKQISTCACNQAQYTQGRGLTDHSANLTGWRNGLCSAWVAIRYEAPDAPRPRVHEAVKGLS